MDSCVYLKINLTNMDIEKRQTELEELYKDLDQRKLVGIILELTIENIDLKKQLSIPRVSSSFSIGDDVIYVGTYVGVVVGEDEVVLKDGTKISSLKTQPQKFRKLL